MLFSEQICRYNDNKSTDGEKESKNLMKNKWLGSCSIEENLGYSLLLRVLLDPARGKGRMEQKLPAATIKDISVHV